MKKLGIIGGAGPLASALFYETLVHECYRLQCPLPEIVLLNYPFQRGLTPEEKQKNGVMVRNELSYCIEALEASGAAVAVLVCNTLHLELRKLNRGVLQFFPIPDLVLGGVKEGSKLLLLGTQNTCNSSLYQGAGFTIFHPSSEGQKMINRVIDHILEGKILKEDADLLERVIEDSPEEIDGVILGCTDLPVLHHHFPIQSDKPVYDSVKIPAKIILRYL